jgi:hypothetical protein
VGGRTASKAQPAGIVWAREERTSEKDGPQSMYECNAEGELQRKEAALKWDMQRRGCVE